MTTPPAPGSAGVFPDMDEAEYHSHPALSYSTGKEYLRSPAHYKHAIENRVEKKAYDVGHAIHALVLGKGAEIVEIPHDTYRTKAAQEARDAAYAEGKTPLKTAELAPVQAAAEAVLANADARKFLELDGEPEVSLFATDPETGIDIRGRVDWLPHAVKGRRTFPVDLKSTNNASPAEVRKTINKFHYDVQASLYRHLIELARGDETGPMVQIYVEPDAPHGVSVVQIAHEDWIEGGTRKLRQILRRHAECVKTGVWPSYPAGVHAIEPPGWYLNDIYDLEEAS